jgi:transposase-like protein
MDVEVLEAVFDKLNSYTIANHNYAIQYGGEKYECPECAGINVKYNKKVVTAAGTVHHWILCKDCKKHYKINHLVFTKYQEYLYKRKSIA